MKRYTVNRYRVWVHKVTGQKVSIHGSLPWTSEAGKAQWELREYGFTVKDNKENTSGFGHPPFATETEAEGLIQRLLNGKPNYF